MAVDVMQQLMQLEAPGLMHELDGSLEWVGRPSVEAKNYYGAICEDPNVYRGETGDGYVDGGGEKIVVVTLTYGQSCHSHAISHAAAKVLIKQLARVVLDLDDHPPQLPEKRKGQVYSGPADLAGKKSGLKGRRKPNGDE